MKPSLRRPPALSGWIIPMLYASLALTAGLTFPRMEHRLWPEFVSTISAPSMMAICSSIASGMIALTGIVFSLTFLMVQFSATAYSPRLVLWLARDPVMSHAMGVFTATFLYSLAVLAWTDRNASGTVPMISGWLVVGFLLASMAMFIALIERVGMLQVNRMLIFTSERGRRAIEELYPAPGLRAAASLPPGATPTTPPCQVLYHVGRPQAIQAIEGPALVALASSADAVLQFSAAVGDTLLEGTPVLCVHHAVSPLDETALRRQVILGDERTFEQDPKYALRLIVDIAIKALSPAINDPTTAVQALDQVEDLLLRLGRRHLEAGTLRDPRGTPRLILPMPSWEDFLRLGLDEIGAYGADSVQVMRRMKALIRHLTEALPPERHDALRYWEKRLQGSIARSFEDAEAKREASVADRQGLGIGEEPVPAPPPSSPPGHPADHPPKTLPWSPT